MRLTLAGIQIRGMARRHSPRHPLFRPTMLSSPACAVTCVLNASYRDLSELAWELGVCVAPSTILRYVPEFEKYWQAHERPVGDSWRADETYLKVRGRWGGARAERWSHQQQSAVRRSGDSKVSEEDRLLTIEEAAERLSGIWNHCSVSDDNFHSFGLRQPGIGSDRLLTQNAPNSTKAT